jgi:hypothetical protein
LAAILEGFRFGHALASAKDQSVQLGDEKNIVIPSPPYRLPAHARCLRYGSITLALDQMLDGIHLLL